MDHQPLKNLSLRLSITDRCDLRCTYCMPADGVENFRHESILRYEEFTHLAKLISQAGDIGKIRITGGEPLVRRNVAGFVELVREAFPDIELCLTTNGQLLAGVANSLEAAGLDRVNVSLDSLAPERYRELTRGGVLQKTLDGIQAAQKAGLGPIKTNCVMMAGFNQDELAPMVKFAMNENVFVRFLELMPIGPVRDTAAKMHLSEKQAVELLQSSFSLHLLFENGTSRVYAVQNGDGKAKIGFVSPVTRPFCNRCDRLRLDSKGRLFACLFGKEHLDLGTMLRAKADEREMVDSIKDLILHKKAPVQNGSKRPMHKLGG